MESTGLRLLGLEEHEIRRDLEEELELAMDSERGLTAHSIAHSVARVLDKDHERMIEQLKAAGVKFPAE